VSDPNPPSPVSPLKDDSPESPDLPLPTPAEVEAELAAIPDPPAATTESPAAASTSPGKGPAFVVRKRRRRKDPTPRILVILFCVWMLCSWFIAQMSDALVRPAQWMVLCSVIGMMVFWPVLRLSQWRDDAALLDNGSADTRRTPGRIFMDWFCLNILFQTVVWPLHMNAHWRPDQTLWISLTLASWSLLTGAIIAMGCRTDRPLRRVVAALICILLLTGEPLLVAATGRLGDESMTFLTSPLALFWQLTGVAAQWTSWPWLIQTPVAFIAGVLAWIIVAVTGQWMGPSPEPGVTSATQG